MKRSILGITWAGLCVCLAIGCSSSEPTTTDVPKEPAAAPPIAATPPATDEKPAATGESAAPDRAAPRVPAAAEPAAPAAAPQLLAQAATMLQAQNFRGALDTLTKVLEQDPKHRAALGLITQASQVRAMELAQAGNEAEAYPLFLKSAGYLRQLQALSVPLDPQERALLPVILYNEACAYAKSNEPDKAMESLKQATANGFRDTAQIDKDPDMEPLRDRDDFKKLRESLNSPSSPAKPKEGESE